MKNIISTFIIGLLLIGCSDLEEEPVGLLSPNSFIKTPQDLQTAVNGSFGYMASEKYWGRKLSLSIMLRGDMVEIGDLGTPARRQDINNFTARDDNGMVTAFWPQSYAIIGAANQALDGAKQIDGEQAVINAIAAQANFSRAFAYYHLVRIFGDIPYIDEAVTDVKTIETISKTPEAEVYQNIIADLEFAKQWLPDTQPTRSLPSNATAMAYLASVYLTLGEHQKAYDEANAIITNAGKHNLGLEADFQDLFDAEKAGALKEPLFTINYIGQNSQGDLGDDLIIPLTAIREDEKGVPNGGWTVAVPSLKVFETWDEKDYRRSVSFDTIGVFNGNVEPYTRFAEFSDRGVNRPHIAKYSRFPGLTASNGRQSSHHYITMRYAEVLLIAAEALNQLQPGSSRAVDLVNQVRARARNKGGVMSNFPENLPSGLSQQALHDAIIEERRLELAFEFKRWYDIKRLQIGPSVFDANGLEPHSNFDEGRDYLFPLPGDELARNPNLLPNNPGY
ncbi:RagB/SusD family nutrient uptake outer membrane protein [Galbibacter sp. BG1]|uniref:RagB/SusD family nutrient uptake outer membrane protein n=1 Tax=Galbibacter sp. BG1 TaxID=1170699 RepID=UPI0015B868C2|nr:RagB/SusD family nutrient uptake outer membrane protein [Galbibacter sp. BG1]QLE00957.1 RagB/SusD family nutrient uptake outer membrane protein [Galbibacter sp. BG1]